MVGTKKAGEPELKQPITTGEKILLASAAVALAIILIPVATGNKSLFWLFAFGAILGGSFPYLIFLYLKDAKSRAMEEQFPNFLRDVSSSKKAGMTLPLAVAKCATSDYGPLSEEVKRMEEQISWGVSFDEALKRFGERIGSSFINKSTTIIIEAYRSGGAISDVLESVSEDAKMIRESDKEKRATMSSYVTTVYMIQFMFVVILVSLNRVLGPLASSPAFSSMGAGLSTLGAGVGGGAGGGGVNLDTYKILFFHMSLIEGFFNGLLAGQIGQNSVIAGLKHSLIFIIVSALIFYAFMFDYNAICMLQPNTDALMAAGCIAGG